MSAFAAEFEAAAPPLEEQFGELVTIARGDYQTPNIPASWFSPGADIQTAAVLLTQVVDRVCVIAKADYQINGAVAEPQTGDQITDQDGDVSGSPAGRYTARLQNVRQLSMGRQLQTDRGLS